MLNGARSLFLSGAAHYPRSTPAMWPQIAANAKHLGLNMVEARD
jgi:beta-galactosidase